MADDKPDETSPLLPGEFVQWKNILWHEISDDEWREKIVRMFDMHWANNVKELPYYADRMFAKMWGDRRDPNA